MYRAHLLLPLTLLTATACAAELADAPEPPPPPTATTSSALTASQRRARSEIIRDAAAAEGLTNGLLLAGIGDGETGLAHCWSEATWACRGPASSSCGGGPVIAGAGDGPCSRRQGGLGLFQFDAGTHSQTLAREGRAILSLDGNVGAAVEFVSDMVVRSRFIASVSNRAEALAWMNRVRIGTADYRAWIRTVTTYYNGCDPRHCSIYSERYARYDNKTRGMLSELGESFWYGGSTPTPPGSGADVPSTPAGLAPEWAEVARGGAVDLSWDTVAGATSYEVDMEYDDGEAWSHYHRWTRSRSPFSVWPALSDTQYRWKVRACNARGCSDWSPAAGFAHGAVSGGGSTDPVTPDELAAPTDLSPGYTTVTEPSITLGWSTVAGATGYDVSMEYWDASAEAWRPYYQWNGRSSTSFTVWPTLHDRQFAWKVRACDATRCSTWSDAEQFHFH